MKARGHTIEGHMMGLNHAHILLLRHETLTVQNIDQIIRANTPDSRKEPKLYRVSQLMLNGLQPSNPNHPCMVKLHLFQQLPENLPTGDSPVRQCSWLA